MKKSKVKIVFDLDPLDWHAHSTERIWAEEISGSDGGDIYRIMNSPFFARGVSYLDLVRARPLSEHESAFEAVIQSSGHSTYMVLTASGSAQLDDFWTPLEAVGCRYESGEVHTSLGKLGLFSVDVPPGADIFRVYARLEEAEAAGLIVFQEGNVGHPLDTGGVTTVPGVSDQS